MPTFDARIHVITIKEVTRGDHERKGGKLRGLFGKRTMKNGWAYAFYRSTALIYR
ncbi:hypothetical protein COLO4_31269 [Corchorus olitorius]|uniref:Uncharacterized protein n=1 Tax=Corchorus olitorius TaxID=93759 RepID=A0A1R3H4Z0_9ROSI|nr:hypothetical protein COLO4_31269 [Corchorus olitorius]